MEDSSAGFIVFTDFCFLASLQVMYRQYRVEVNVKTKIFIIVLKKYSFNWNEKVFIRFLMNKKEMYLNGYFHSFFIHLFEY